MKQLLPVVIAAIFYSCNDQVKSPESGGSASPSATSKTASIDGHWEGSFTNGMKETYISFDVSKNGKELQNLSFKGYWRCDGKLEQTTLGPEKHFNINGNKVDGTVSEPEGGGAAAIRYELHAAFNGDTAEGSFRMNINALACDTYKLNWKATKK